MKRLNFETKYLAAREWKYKVVLYYIDFVSKGTT